MITYSAYNSHDNNMRRSTFAYKTANKGSLLAQEFAEVAIPENMQEILKIPANTPFNIEMIFDCGQNED